MIYKKHTVNFTLQSKGRMWFTLVELVVVATILAILWAVWFSSYTGYIPTARDSNRIAELANIRAGLQSYNIKASLPYPTEYVSINDGATTLWYQGYVGEEVLNSIDLKKWWKDPKDGNYYSYYLSKSRNHFQLLAFLEKEESQSLSYSLQSSTQAMDYSSRYPMTTGASLWILLWTGNNENVPVQEIETVQTASFLDIGATTDLYTAIINDNYSVSGDSNDLQVLTTLENTWGYIWESCKNIKNARPWVYGEDGLYFIQPDKDSSGFEVVCDMTTDGWWWTQIKTTAWGWMIDSQKLLMPDASELMFDYNSNFTWEYIDHKYKISKFVALWDGTSSSLDNGQEITSSSHMIDIILWKSPDVWDYRWQHYGDLLEFRWVNVWKNYDECHDNENLSQSNYSMRSFRFYKNYIAIHGWTIWIWWWWSYGDHNIFQTNYCGGYTTNNDYRGNRTDLYIR